MANYVLKELPGEMTDGRTVVYPKMQIYSQHNYVNVIHNMRVYANGIGEGIIRAVFDALAQTMITWMPLGHTMKIWRCRHSPRAQVRRCCGRARQRT